MSQFFDLLPEPASRLAPGLDVRKQNVRSVSEFGDRPGEPCHAVHFGRDQPCDGCNVKEVLSTGREARWFLVHAQDDAAGPRYYEITVVPLKDEAGQVSELVEIIRDTTATMGVEQQLIRTSEDLEAKVARRSSELKRLAEQTTVLNERMDALQRDQAVMLQTQKMASLGSLAAGLTHEIHTPLGALISNLDMVRRSLTRMQAEQPTSDCQKQLDICRRLLELQEEAAERIRKIIGSLREFSHLDRAVMEPYDLHRGIDSALDLLQHLTRGRVEIVRKYADLPVVICRPDALNQVFMNLLQNAVQAIDGAGTITIRTLQDGAQVCVEVIDTGCGIPAADLDRVFEPGFTTKARGVGTGLGLAITYSTVQDHGGSVEVQSDAGRGATFRVRLPVLGRSSEQQQSQQDSIGDAS